MKDYKYHVMKEAILTACNNAKDCLEATEERLGELDERGQLWALEYGRKNELLREIELFEKWIKGMKDLEAKKK